MAMAVANGVRVRHSKLGREATVPRNAVKHWVKSGWTIVKGKEDKEGAS